MSVETRAATADDEESVRALIHQLGNTGSGWIEPEGFPRVFRTLLDDKRGRIILAQETGEGGDVILGMASVSYNLAMRYGGEYCQLEELIVTEAARGKNVGALLVQRTLADAEARGCTDYGLYLVAHTEQNRGFYEKFGLEVVGTEMRKTLAV